MAEAILSVVLDQLTSFIRNEVEQEVRLVVGVREELNNLHTHLTLIKAVLEDAEKKEIHDNAIKVWLVQLKDVMYDAEDVLDEWNTRILISANGPHVANRVRSYLLSLCACFKHVGVRHDIAHRIKGIREGLDVIARSKDQLGLVQSHGHKEAPQLTSSVVDVSEIFGRDQDKQEILSNHKIRHLTVDDVENPSIYEAKKLRTLLVGKKTRSVPSALHQLTCLRTLDLSYKYSNHDFEVLPSEVSRLLHLRYLDLSNNVNLKELPETVRSLVNLQTLKLKWCESLCKLPEGIGELSNLRHLEVERTNHLKYYPRGGIERLSQLRTLSKFVVSDGSSKGSVIGELGNLNFLKRSLSITGLRNVKSGNEAKEAQLQKKENISSLVLNFGYLDYGRDIGDVSSEEEIRRMEGVLENLEPHKESLEQLEIRNYVGSTLPTWMRMMSNITSLSLDYCPNLKVEPHYLFPPRLETLVLWRDVGVLSKSLMSLTHNNNLNLKTLYIIESPHSSLPQGLNQLTSLQELNFVDCPTLDFKPEELKPLTMLRELDIGGCSDRTREEDWSILTHIPTIEIEGIDIKRGRN
ncbi:hypothetical protein IFM89_026960 [Coptis chinensis]|uniref:Rx N-terminal domain-containing protein n=1 Tax=Coptis chinensis TaxID=261450 RepID=A0A835I5K2_9MAGN|nr:hypothetical protein IFM89_026960 [Coptis chinensis]